MTGFEIIILIGLIVLLAVGVGYYMNKGQASLKEMEEEPKKDIVKYQTFKTITESAKELVKEVEKVIENPPTTQEESQQLAKDIEQAVTSPIKKKRKYYPKKKKTGDK